MSGWTGPVFQPGDPGYDDEHRSINETLEHRPELIVGAASAEDVVSAVRYAIDRSLSVGVQSTGHGLAVAADGVLVSTRRMKQVTVDPATRTATIDAGVQWHDVLPVAAQHGLAPLNGSSPHVGVMGYTLGGGVGLLGRRFGFAADHVRRIDVVTADGFLRHVDADHDPDLFFALRGGKGNYGVATRIEIELFPVRTLLGGGLYFAADAATELLHTYSAWTRSVPEAMSSSVMLSTYPDTAGVPDPLRGRYVAHLRIGFFGPPDEGETLIAPFRQLAPPLLDTLTQIPYTDIGTIHHEPIAPYKVYESGIYLGPPDAEAVDTILRHAGPDANAPVMLELRHHGGAYRRTPAVPNAVGGRDAEFTLYLGSLIDPETMATDKHLHNEVHGSLRPWATGTTMLNFFGVGTALASVRTAFTAETFQRLRDIKTEYDPRNMFRINHNIPPQTRSALPAG
ncbi:MAG TPA: FAD-binding oxidoreductase [Ilumatobacteraceae bacterium]|nr:FAD-binding oxidoreductase [Ilumatobacteraceae bacterium]